MPARARAKSGVRGNVMSSPAQGYASFAKRKCDPALDIELAKWVGPILRILAMREILLYKTFRLSRAIEQ